jgi:hypothetical protein
MENVHVRTLCSQFLLHHNCGHSFVHAVGSVVSVAVLRPLIYGIDVV